MTTAANTILEWTERGLVPDSVIRAGIRRLCRQRLKDICASDPQASGRLLEDLVRAMNAAPVALLPERANEQHYEVPPAFFDEVLGEHRKYSCCYWDDTSGDLGQAEAAALRITCERAGIEDGQAVLDLGCGWGSLSLWIAERYPACAVTAVSNSAPQRRHIERLAVKRGLVNVRVLTRDMNDFPRAAMTASSRWRCSSTCATTANCSAHRGLAESLRPLFHAHLRHAAAPTSLSMRPDGLMGRHFLRRIMPSDDLPLRFQEDLRLLRRDRWNGQHYQRTANAWLDNMDRCRDAILPILAATYGEDRAEQWFQRWRIFFMACAELFGMEDGREWYVAHYLFARRDDEADASGGGVR
jgi:cyclopropane-fatty-acyl-phospholipid synthase